MFTKNTHIIKKPMTTTRFKRAYSDQNSINVERRVYQHLLNVKSKQYVGPLGNTDLHRIAECGNEHTLAHFIKHPDSAIMARTVNDAGKLPYDLMLENSQLSPKARKEMTALFIDLMSQNELKPLGMPINSHEILNRHYPLMNTDLYRNLKLSCAVANEARQKITASTTHPDLNSKCTNDIMKVIYGIKKLRDDCETLPGKTVEEYLSNITQTAMVRGLGNCYEFGVAALTTLINTDKSSYGTLYNLNKGDHVFLALNTAPLKRTAEGTALNAVICDAWAGDVYPAYELPLRLNGYRCVLLENRPSLNVITNYNPKLHSVSTEVSLHGTVKLGSAPSIRLFDKPPVPQSAAKLGLDRRNGPTCRII